MLKKLFGHLIFTGSVVLLCCLEYDSARTHVAQKTCDLSKKVYSAPLLLVVQAAAEPCLTTD